MPGAIVDWRSELGAFQRDARAAVRALATVLEVEPASLIEVARLVRRGSARLDDGRRLVWRFHSAGVRIRLAKVRPVDVDFDGPNGLMSDVLRLAAARGLERPSEAEVAGLLEEGLVAAGGRFRVELTLQ